jgi:hypothetical protein
MEEPRPELIRFSPSSKKLLERKETEAAGL